MSRERSNQLWREARGLLPGGVNSPVRAFGSVDGEPFFSLTGKGSRIRDVDGNEYIDYVLSFGPLILGHAHPEVTSAAREALEAGTHFGTSTPLEVALAKKVVSLVPSLEMLRCVNSGTEATMSAIRLARAVTGRDLILKFDGCYHGHGDAFLAKAGSGLATYGLSASPGVPADIAKLTLTVPYNDSSAVRAVFAQHADSIAAVIVEPILGNSGLIQPAEGFLESLREMTRRQGALLIFDEVMTGFRVALGGAQERFDIAPDITTLGKVIGGGLPVGAYGASQEIMSRIAPAGDVYQAGTLSGNPVAMAAGLAQLEVLEREPPYSQLEERGTRLVEGILEAARRHGVPGTGAAVGSMWGIFFCQGPVRNFDDAQQVDRRLFAAFHQECLKNGVFLPPSPFETCFLSTAHSDADIDETLAVIDRALAKVAASG